MSTKQVEQFELAIDVNMQEDMTIEFADDFGADWAPAHASNWDMTLLDFDFNFATDGAFQFNVEVSPPEEKEVLALPVFTAKSDTTHNVQICRFVSIWRRLPTKKKVKRMYQSIWRQ